MRTVAEVVDAVNDRLESRAREAVRFDGPRDIAVNTPLIVRTTLEVLVDAGFIGLERIGGDDD